MHTCQLCQSPGPAGFIDGMPPSQPAVYCPHALQEAFIEILKQRKAEEAAQRALEAERGLEDPTASEPTCKSGINSSGEGASASGNDDGAPTCRLTAAAVAADGSGDRAALNNALKAGGYSAEP